MSVVVMLVVLVAALLHASWNFQVKQRKNKHESMSAVVLGHVPFAALALLFSPSPRPESYAYLIAGAFLHTGYQLFLLNAYRIGDLSQVYPLARGVAPLIVAGISVVFLGVHLAWLEIAAIVTIGAGIMSLAMVRRSDGRRNGRAVALALMTGGFIASYSLVDGLGARQAGTALGFYGWLSLINAAVFATIMRLWKPGLVRRVICQDRGLALKGGGQSFFAYALVIWSFTLAPIALVTAVRETSIIFALLLGVFLLKEPVGRLKVMATLLTLIGVVLLRFNG